MESLETEIFKGKTMSGLIKDIYSNSVKKDKQINTLISELTPLISNIGDATMIVPLIKDYMEISVRNDDALVKLAAVLQRLVSANSKSSDVSGSPFVLTDEEKSQILAEIEGIKDTGSAIATQLDSISKKSTESPQ